jgi:hypothetical protein
MPPSSVAATSTAAVPAAVIATVASWEKGLLMTQMSFLA